jgi:hypothetical protein
MLKFLTILLALIAAQAAAGAIPATPVMTLYRFNGDLNLPVYFIESVERQANPVPAGTLTQGTSVVPCLVIRNGRPLTDASGTPYVGFEIVVDSRTATAASAEIFKNAVALRKGVRVQNHHCGPSVRYVLDVRNLFILNKPPFFDLEYAPSSAPAGPPTSAPLDEIIRSFHASADCRDANRRLVGRRDALARAWEAFIQTNPGRWPGHQLERAKHLDYTLRTAIYESHLGRGCNAYAACERNIIALSIRNRGRVSCATHQGCRFPGDYQGVASKVSQYNIWDEYLTQVTGLTACFLRPDSNNPLYEKIDRIYRQNVAAVEKILFDEDGSLGSIFPSSPLSDLNSVRHYYHAPAMGKCFPDRPYVEYITGAVAKNGSDFALIANQRIEVGAKVGRDYRFHEFILREDMYHDQISVEDNYPGFTIDGRKVELKTPANCAAYGIPAGCRFDKVARYRKTPPWLSAGKPLELGCAVEEFGEECRKEGKPALISVGGSCDTQMRPVGGVR